MVQTLVTNRTSDENRHAYEYSGIEQEGSEMRIPFHSFCDLAESRAKGEKHFADSFNKAFYLSQCQILDSNNDAIEGVENGGDKPEALFSQSLLDGIVKLDDLPNTNCHYDSYNNLLSVSRGEKIVALLPPSRDSLRLLKPCSVASRSPNHSSLKKREFYSSLRSLALENGGDKPKALVAVLREGDTLFIPEGWWHQVTSVPLTTGLNVFFRANENVLPNPTVLNLEEKAFDLVYPLRFLLARTASCAASRLLQKHREEFVEGPLFSQLRIDEWKQMLRGWGQLTRSPSVSVVHALLLNSTLDIIERLSDQCDKAIWTEALMTIPPSAAFNLIELLSPSGNTATTMKGSRDAIRRKELFNKIFESIQGGETKQSEVLKWCYKARDEFVHDALKREISELCIGPLHYIS
eukprot:CAMPEP_0114537646 /NCGR_PEP_ID=MMETSP0109-20121206/29694_1 /TAXON_ID=29199 /ORGANISM="Chlorarachnion reptans, Strain CCCM449" /LENGTH=407 /DNA_ID=CAMNT_0001721559 /DNA_START=8 /DNA_END=1231 /DNA_ORIENTATION=-